MCFAFGFEKKFHQHYHYNMHKKHQIEFILLRIEGNKVKKNNKQYFFKQFSVHIILVKKKSKPLQQNFDLLIVTRL
jgi:hypothetical protein